MINKAETLKKIDLFYILYFLGEAHFLYSNMGCKGSYMQILESIIFNIKYDLFYNRGCINEYRDFLRQMNNYNNDY